MAGSEASKEAIHVAALARELGLHDESPIDLGMDNRSAIDVAHNPEHHGRMKHVSRRHFFIRECVENHLIRVPFVRTDENDADFFTKVLPGRNFFPLRNKIMNTAVTDRVRTPRCAPRHGARPRAGPRHPAPALSVSRHTCEL